MKNRSFDLQPVLTGKLIQLRPILGSDFDELYESASDPEIWRQHPQPNRYQKEIFLNFFNGAIASKGGVVIVDLTTKKIIGSSRYYDLNQENAHITIGYTFLSTAYWGGKFNWELKALMIGHALQFVDFVFFEIGSQNLRSRRAIEKIGATLYKHSATDDNARVIYRIDENQFRRAFA